MPGQMSWKISTTWISSYDSLSLSLSLSLPHTLFFPCAERSLWFHPHTETQYVTAALPPQERQNVFVGPTRPG